MDMGHARMRRKGDVGLLRFPRAADAHAAALCVAYIWRDGVIELGRRAPEGTLELARGPRSSLDAFLQCLAPRQDTGFRLSHLQAIACEQSAVAWLRTALERQQAYAGGCQLNLPLDTRFIAA